MKTKTNKCIGTTLRCKAQLGNNKCLVIFNRSRLESNKIKQELGARIEVTKNVDFRNVILTLSVLFILMSNLRTAINKNLRSDRFTINFLKGLY